jgi:hypothetical protein
MIALLKPVRRKTAAAFLHYKTPIVVELKPATAFACGYYATSARWF